MGSVSRRSGALVATGAVVLLGSGCSSAERPEVERVAGQFLEASGNPEARCELLMPRTLQQLEQEAEAPCADAIGGLPLQGGEVTDVEVWGGEAQVRMSGDTVFLTQSSSGWRIAAALCRPQPEGPYDCQVEGS